MALISCPECNSEISDKARVCPKCGTILIKPKRTIFGQVIKYSFILFNLFMIYWFIVGIGGAASTIDSSSSEAERSGAAIGTGIGIMFLLTIWALGAGILGLFTLLTRPKN